MASTIGGDTQNDDGHHACNELDTRADTCCLGANFRFISDTGQVCNVSGFHDSFDSIKDIPVARGATKWICPDSGHTFILFINQGLWFGSSLDHSLINPNQIRSFGIPVSDDPFDQSRLFGINHPEMQLAFETKGATIFFESTLPSQEDIENPLFTHITLTDDQVEWDPQNIRLSSDRPYGDQRASVKALRTNIRNYSERHEIDVVLSSVSSALVPQEMEQRMVSAVKITAKESVSINKVASSRPHQERIVNGRRIMQTASTSRHSTITPERVSRVFGIGLNKAHKTLDVTTQQGIRHAVMPLNRRYRVDRLDLHSEYLGGKWTMDWLSARAKSISGDTGAFVITNGNFVETYPQPNHQSSQAAASLNDFMRDIGIPKHLKTDSAQEFVGAKTEFVKTVKKKGIDLTYAEGERKNQVWQADVAIRGLKTRWHDTMVRKKVPRRVWNFGLKHAAKIMQMIPGNKHGSRTGYEQVTGKTPDISELLDFEFWDPVWYWAESHPSVSEPARALGRWMGISHRVGSSMCYWIMPVNGKPISETTVQHVTEEDMRNPDIAEQVKVFNEKLTERLDDTNHILPDDGLGLGDLEDLMTSVNVLSGILDKDGDGDTCDPPEVVKDYWDDADIDTYDKFIGAKIRLTDAADNGGNLATVKRRVTDSDGRPVGTPHRNPLLDTTLYEVELDDGTYDQYSANTIAENIYAQTDDEGRETMLLNDICGHRKDGNAISVANGFTRSRNGDLRPKITTAGWFIKLQWKDGSTDELPLRVVKESNPVELAEYCVAHGLMEEPAFKWWVPKVLRRRDRIISKAKTKYWRTNSKFGIRLPKTVEEALRIDRENGNDFWEKALKKEMTNVRVSYKPHEAHTPDEIRQGKAKELIGYTEISCRIIFDVKMDLTRKCRLVAGGHMTEAPSCLTYSSVVSRDSVRLAFMIAALNDLEVGACDIGNAYLNAQCREKVWFQAGKECGEHEGKAMIITRALYGLRSSGAAWRAMFSTFILKELGFESTRVDSDVYRRKSFYTDSNGNQVAYYELLLVYVDDVLLVSKKPSDVMTKIGERFRLKDGWAAPTQYLGAEIYEHIFEDGDKAWGFSSKTYITNVVKQVKEMLADDGKQLKGSHHKKKNHGPLPVDYRPELDDTRELEGEMISRYQQIIGMLRWGVELGRIDILIDVALMSQYNASPREGHLEALYHIIHYLERHPDRKLVMDAARVRVDESVFQQDADWTEFYGDVVEEDPADMPEPLGRSVRITSFMDSDHAGNRVTRRSHSGIFIFVNNALIVSYSKKQNTVESATFGSEMVAMRIARDLTVALRIKLKMFGVPIDGPADFYCDNNGVVKNTSIPSSQLAKKHNSINFHMIREAVAAGICRVGKEDTLTNTADAATKILSYSRRESLLGPHLY
jgi:hypothetical protein